MKQKLQILIIAFIDVLNTLSEFLSPKITRLIFNHIYSVLPFLGKSLTIPKFDHQKMEFYDMGKVNRGGHAEAFSFFAKKIMPLRGNIYNIGASGDKLEYFLDARQITLDKTIQYYRVDIDPRTNPDIYADMHNLSIIPTGNASVVICTASLLYSADPDTAFREMARILKPGGMLYCYSSMFIARNPEDYYCDQQGEKHKDSCRVLCRDLLSKESVQYQFKRFGEISGLKINPEDEEYVMTINSDHHAQYKLFDINEAKKYFKRIEVYPSFDSTSWSADIRTTGKIHLVIVGYK